MSAVERVEALTLEEYSRLYDQEGAFELIDGTRQPLMLNVAGHGWLVRAFFTLLFHHCTSNRLGEVFSEIPFVLVYQSNWVKGSRVPDVMFYSAERWQQYTEAVPDWQRKPIVLVPDLAVEVISPNDFYSEIQDKVERYLSDGVGLVWVVDPQGERVTTYEGTQYAILSRSDALTGGSVLAGLSIALDEVFGQV